MKVGDNIILNDDIDIGEFNTRHGMVIGIDNGNMFPVEILFADGVLQNYNHRECRVISDKEYFKLQLS